MTKQFWANLALCGILGSLAIFAAANLGSTLTSRGLLAFEPQVSAEAAPLMKQLVLADYQVGKGEHSVVEAVFSVQNNSDKDVKNVEVICLFADMQGTYADSKKWTLFETIPAGQTLHYNQTDRRFINTRALNIDCRITDFQLVKEPFFALERVAAAGGHGGTETGHGMAPHAPAGH